jgi:hypothetical protein
MLLIRLPNRFDTRHALVWLALLCVPAQSSQTAREEPAAGFFPAKETFYYTVEWRLITAGDAVLKWSQASSPAQPAWQVKLRLESTGLVSKLYKIDDDYTADLGPGLCICDTHLNAHEGSRQRDTVVHFDAETRKASYLERDLKARAVALAKETDIPACVHDVIGGLFYLRTLKLEPGRSIQVPVSDGKKSVSARVEAQAREEIKVPAGTFKTIRYEAFLFDNVLYRRPGHLYAWLTDDARRIPVRVQVRLHFTIGTITVLLQKEDKT